MRINNPRTLAGYSRIGLYDESSYKLATIGQLEAAIKKLDAKIINILVGTGENRNGLGGLTNKCGYAWIAENGKISPDLLPTLAITETYVIYQADLEAASVSDNLTNDAAAGALERLEYWKKYGSGSGPEYSGMQKGDIVIVSPNEEGPIRADLCGSYIVVYSEGGDFKFAKFAYESGNIVSINNEFPNSTGAMTLRLEDILKTGSDSPVALANNTYRISSEQADENSPFRFVFDGNAYAMLTELNNEISARTAQCESINSAVNVISEKIGNVTDDADSSVNATLLQQIKALRADIQNMNEHLSAIDSQIAELYSRL